MVDHSRFLTENKLMTLASLSPNKAPGAVPVAFMYEGGRLYVSTGRRTRKVRNVEGDGRVAFAVEDSTRQKAVVGKGTARILPAGKSHDELLKRLVIHLAGSLDHPYAKIMLGADRVLLEITPRTMKSWDLPPTE